MKWLIIILVQITISFAAKPLIIIDAGHGGRDKGAWYKKIYEKDLNLSVAHKLSCLLRANGFNTLMTRTGDYFLSLKQRRQIIDNYPNAISICIHFNSIFKKLRNQISGVETFYGNAKSKPLAVAVHKKMLTALRRRDRGVIKKNFAMVQAKPISILVECGYISHFYERKLCSQQWYQALCAGAIYDGIITYLKKKK